ncbi:type II toxin-antitoxin system VapB family antitoxin [Frankia sp. CNm7]|uniref:Type II toxin-antitoxin system VapB family antitoxin n=1 Tax=Frankia nepalensis TaxID=1836974 RepID=A0A937R7V0_9ACTN|nr:type II toxin-antitoxin system VapB family antitoxin [Frankia nepalensis]MBL7499232.1 type II toxin-antitoxin system VapB family antitoxin [Frankia nepalensis]MBL7512122.1 type II toxin-antitoxin system VapB family antitoxin [Frankia nepalensis]MBL7521029.1 type II toxin-antitoxin system VapB family antitoxin [Frankia nepalensis]MBL7627303.1 type II toxin-antitoxin system VapB family antitoxin [Frankia nepalensis]
MALNVKDPETERLAVEVTALADETTKRAINAASRERRQRPIATRTAPDRRARLLRFLTDEAWPRIPPDHLGHAPTKAERERILGYGREGG